MERRSNEYVSQALRDVSSARKLEPSDVIRECEKAGSGLAVFSLDARCEAYLSQKLRDTDVVYRSGDKVQVFAPVSRDGCQTLLSKIIDVAGKSEIHVTFLERPSDLMRAYGSNELADIALGKECKSEQAYVAGRNFSKEDAFEYLKTIHNINPSVLGGQVKVVFVPSNDFECVRVLETKAGWALVERKGSRKNVEDISYMVKDKGFVVYGVPQGQSYAYDRLKKALIRNE